MTILGIEISRPWWEWQHARRKLLSTCRILLNLGMARTFGRYLHSEWNGEMDYAVYEWRGRTWAFPTSPLIRERTSTEGGLGTFTVHEWPERGEGW